MGKRKRNIGLAGLCAFSILAPAAGAAAKDGPREAVAGFLERVGPANLILPDVPAPPAVKPAWEGRLEKWLKALGDDDYFVREKATQEMLQEEDPKFAEKLQAILPAQSDPEVAARLLRIVEGLRVLALRSKLSARLLAKSPAVAEKALSSEKQDLQEALSQMIPPKDARGAFREEEMAASTEDIKILLPAVLGGLEAIEPDITRLDDKTKGMIRLVLSLYSLEARPGMKDHAPYIAGLLKDPASMLRGHAIMFLSVLRPDAETIGEAVAMLRDAHWFPRDFAVDALARMDAKDKEPEILALLDDPSLFVRKSCVYFLRRQTNAGDQKALAGVAARLSDAEKDVVFPAVETLSSWGKLEDALLAAQPGTAKRVIGFLVEWGRAQEYRKTLEALAKHPDPAVVQAANAALKSIQEKLAK